MQQQTRSVTPHILFGMFLLEVFFLFIKKVDGTIYGVFDLVEKLYPILAIGLLVAFMKPRLNRNWWIALMLYSGYLLYGILISLANQKGLKIIVVQLYHELKFFPMIFVFAMARCDQRWNSRTLVVIKFLIYMTVLLILFQLAAPGAYDAIFKNGGHFEKGHIAGMLLPRLVGWFWHPSQIALFFLISAIFFLHEYKRGTIRLGFSLVMLCVIFVFIAIQRLELFILFLSLLTLLFHRYLGFNYRPYLALVVGLLFLFVLFYLVSDKDNVWKLLEDFSSPRMVFLVEATFTLFESNYLGAGWGTIGSHAAADVARVYEYNAMKDIWWVKLGQYYYDTYWPHVIGETGVPGFLLLLSSMLFMLLALNNPKASLLLFVLLLSSAMSSNLQSLYHLTVFGWFIMLFENEPVTYRNLQPKQSPVTRGQLTRSYS